MVLKRSPQRRQRQLPIQQTAQLPTANDTSINIHNHCQVDEFLLQSHISDVVPPTPRPGDAPSVRPPDWDNVEAHGYRPFLFTSEWAILVAFFAISNCIVNHPTICSSSVIRACSPLLLTSLAKARLACARNCCFQFPTIWALNWYSRHTSARLFSRK